MPTQNHIHLSLSLGGSPEKAPTLKWAATQRARAIIIFADVGETSGAYSYLNRTRDESGVEIQKNDYRYRVKVAATNDATTEERAEALIAMAGKLVWFCDHVHPDDGEDHTSAVRRMFMTIESEFLADHPTLDFYYVDIYLKDFNRAI